MSSKQTFHRRQLLTGAAAAATFTIIPRHVLGSAGTPSANSKLNIAGVGVGGMGPRERCSKCSQRMLESGPMILSTHALPPSSILSEKKSTSPV